jgi:hypothetical protein
MRGPAERRQFEPEELEAVAACSLGTGALLALAGRLDRSYPSVYAKKRELVAASRMRKDCGAFLPDDGLPYRVAMQRLYRNAAWQAAITAYPSRVT